MIEVRATTSYPSAMSFIDEKVFSGVAPFADSTPTSAVVKVLSGERPERPKDPVVTDKLWALIQLCWERTPRRRPEITDVVSCLRGAMATRNNRQTNIGDANTRSVQPWWSSPSRVAPTGSNDDIPSSRLSLRHLWPRKLGKITPQVRYDAHRASSIESKGSYGLDRVESGRFDSRGGGQNTLSGPFELLRRARTWFLNCGKPSAFDYQEGTPILVAGKGPRLLVGAFGGWDLHRGTRIIV